MPNIFAYIILYSWPLVAYLIFRTHPAARAMMWTFVLGYLFMPPAAAGFNLPVLPTISKIEMSALSALIMTAGFHGYKSIQLPKSNFMRAVVAIYVLGPILTIATNSEQIIIGNINSFHVIQPALNVTQIPSFVLERFFDLIPFLLGFSLLKSKENLRDLLIIIVMVSSLHTVLALFEIRFAPVLNIWIFGFFQHEWTQMLRAGGFRPIVFQYHALWLGFFLVVSLAGSLSLYLNWEKEGRSSILSAPHRVYYLLSRSNPGNIYLYLALYFAVTLILAKSLGPIMYGIAVVLFLVFLKPRTLLLTSVLIAAAVYSYPLLKALQILPETQVLQFFNTISPDRARSLEFRLLNESILVDRAMEKPLFGWGGFARNLIVSPFGGIVTIPDGGWIIELGRNGLFGWFSQTSLMLAPVISAYKWRKLDAYVEYSPHIGAMCLLLLLNALDMVPNDTMTLITLLVSGAAWGHLELLTKRHRAGQLTEIRSTKLHMSDPILANAPTSSKKTII